MTTVQLLEYTNRIEKLNWAKVDNGRKLEYLLDRLSLLDNDEQKELILSLSERFEYVDILDFMVSLPSAFKKAVLQKRQEGKSVLVAPLKSPFVDVGKLVKSPDGRSLFTKSKSPDMVYTLVKNSLTDEDIIETVHFCDEPKKIAEQFDETCSILLIDDFVGSGLTAYKHVIAYIELLKQYKLYAKNDNFCIVVDIVMKQGVEYLSSFGIECYYDNFRTKAISEDGRLSEDQVNNDINLMKAIESKLFVKLNPNFSLGFCGSESLVSILNKAPNNTFPFYWKDCVGNKKPIFRRHYE